MTTPTFIDDLKSLLAIPSTADNGPALHAAVDAVAARINGHSGVTVERFEHNGKPSLLAYAGKTRPQKFAVLLNGHLDVVPAKPEQFKPIEKDGKLFGRGALDMKAAALVLTDVFCELAATAPFALGLQIVSDEEVGGHDGAAYQIAQGVQANFVIAGEFTKPGQICTASRGICQLRVYFSGTTAHSAYPWNGDNAAVRASAVVQKLLEHYPVPAHEEWVTTVNISGLNTPGDTFNTVPETTELRLDCRYVPDDEHFASRETIDAFFKSLDSHCSVEVVLFEPAHAAPEDDPYVQKLAAALRQTGKHDVSFIKKPGGSDVRFYSEQGTTAVVYGLQGQGIHSDDEYLELASLDTYHDTLTSFLRSTRP